MEEDAELEDTQELHTTMKWFSFTPEVAAELQHKYSQEEIDMTDTQGGNVKVQIDRHGDVSIFATVTEVKHSKVYVSEASKDLRDDVSAVTNGSYETRITLVEEKLGDFGTKLDTNTATLQKSSFKKWILMHRKNHLWRAYQLLHNILAQRNIVADPNDRLKRKMRRRKMCTDRSFREDIGVKSH